VQAEPTQCRQSLGSSGQHAMQLAWAWVAPMLGCSWLLTVPLAQLSGRAVSDACIAPPWPDSPASHS